jgi:protein phosphatase
MQDSQVAIQCINHNCQAANPFNNKVCQQCGTPIVKRYLRVLDRGIDDRKIGSLLEERYLIVQNNVVLDVYPGLPPKMTEDLPEFISTYLKLSPFKPHIPQVYGLASIGDRQEVWLLEYGTVPFNTAGSPEYTELLPRITDVWQQQNPLRQLNWLAQMAKLWQPLTDKDVAASLLQPELLRFNGTLLQLQELVFGKENPSLADLGRFWAGWITDCDPSIKEFCTELCRRLESKEVDDIDRLLSILAVAMQECGRSYYYQYRIFTCTDSGPMRERNEDSCYPEPGILVQPKDNDKTVAIVCDGVGGHEGGEIASKLTIEYLTEKLNNITLNKKHWDSESITEELAKYVCGANDIISNRNDYEKRHQRQRMGTTLVMTFAHAHEMYVAHVGDSRIYWVTKNSCHQLTVDDDLASREVRLGYALYRDASQYPSAGALVQALGMSSSDSLYPNIQRFILDEDGVFLLCSDGLSDFDRVEQYWEMQIQTILNYNANIPKAGRELIKIANDRNGHDNVTVALVYCQVQRSIDDTQQLSWSEIAAVVDQFTPTQPRVSQIRTVNNSKDSGIVYPESRIILNPQIPSPPLPPTSPTRSSSKNNKLTLYLTLLLALLSAFVLGFFAYLFLNPKLKRDSPPPSPTDLNVTPSIDSTPFEPDSTPTATPEDNSQETTPSETPTSETTPSETTPSETPTSETTPSETPTLETPTLETTPSEMPSP